MVVVASPLAYSIALTPDDGDTLSAEAVVLNKPVGGTVGFSLDGGSEITAAGSGNVYSVEFAGVADGEHEVTAILRDADDREVEWRQQFDGGHRRRLLRHRGGQHHQWDRRRD